MKWTTIFISLALLAPSMAVSQEKMDVAEALDYVAGELSECAAFYTVWSLSVEGMESDVAKSVHEHSIASSSMAMTAASLFLDQELVQARIRTSAQGMMRRIDGDASRIGLLTADYSLKCKDLLGDIGARIVELTSQ